jgi:hypothetical protein
LWFFNAKAQRRKGRVVFSFGCGVAFGLLGKFLQAVKDSGCEESHELHEFSRIIGCDWGLDFRVFVDYLRLENGGGTTMRICARPPV